MPPDYLFSKVYTITDTERTTVLPKELTLQHGFIWGHYWEKLCNYDIWIQFYWKEVLKRHKFVLLRLFCHPSNFMSHY